MVRTESDALGSIEVAQSAYWGAQTQRSLENFAFPDSERMPPAIIHALATIKLAAARVNARHGMDGPIAIAIEQAATEVRQGKLDDQFPLTIWQTGSGTQTNMNVNEVIAGRANELLVGKRGGKQPVHPNDHVNLGQSSNDTFPSAIHIAAANLFIEKLDPALDRLIGAIDAKVDAWASIVKLGRTHLQDAVPLTLGQEFSGYAEQARKARNRLHDALNELLELAQGGTAVGTGLGAPPEFSEAVAEELVRLTGIGFVSAPNKFAAIASNDALVAFSAALSGLAVAISKIANDLRLLASGPRAGLGELIMPANEPGSSIMPGKVNPTQCEMLTMVAAQVIGNHTSVTFGGIQGHLELNAYKPLIGANLLRSLELLAAGIDSFVEHALLNLSPDRDRIEQLLGRSLMLVTALIPTIGYEKAAQIAQRAYHDNSSLREAALASGWVDAETFDRIVQADKMV